MEAVGTIMDAITTTQPYPDLAVIVGLGVVALVLAGVPLLWRPTRMLITIAHEAGHAVVAALAGRKLQGIRLHHDTSGLTISRGRPTGPGAVATLFAGYPTPALVGLVTALVLGTGHATALLWGFLLMLALMLLSIRNLYGLLVLLVVGGVLGAATWWLDPVWHMAIAMLLCWIMLVGAVRPVLDVARSRDRGSDPSQLARMTRLPRGLWVLAFLVIAVGCLLVGAYVLVTAAAPGLFAV